MGKVKYMKATFEYCKNLEELSNTSKWNLENVETLKGLFYQCTKLKKIPGIDKWNPKNLKNYDEMFFGCQKSLEPSILSQVKNWKNVPEKGKNDFTKGFSATNKVSYSLIDNTEVSLKLVQDNVGGALKFVGDNLGNIMKNCGNLFNLNKNKK